MSRLIAEITEILSPTMGMELTGPQWVRVRIRVTGIERGATMPPREVVGREGAAERAVRFGWEMRVGKRIVLSREESRQFLPAVAAAPAPAKASRRREARAPSARLARPVRWGASRQARGS
jgi:hypothetical protein